MKVITLLNQKGGVGKTTLTAHIGAGLANRGYRVLMVDTDPQGSLSWVFGIEPQPGVYNLIIRNETWDKLLTVPDQTIYRPEGVTGGLLALLPGNVETRSIGESTNKLLAFRRRLAEIQAMFDYVLIDTSPTPSLLHGSILMATDYVLYPVELDAPSTAQGLVDSSATVTQVQEIGLEYNLKVGRHLGIIPNKYQGNTVVAQTILAGLRDQYGDAVWEPLRRSVTYVETGYEQRLLFAYSKGNGALAEMNLLVDRVVKETQNAT
ncbi:MAG: ParA family protein [Phototrophicaceae bacterium]|jgi:chromosome partitioning protein